MTAHEIAWDIVKVLSGGMGAGILLIFGVVQKQSRLDGKVDILIGMMNLSQKNSEIIGRIEQKQEKHSQDLNKCYKRIKVLESHPQRTLP